MSASTSAMPASYGEKLSQFVNSQPEDTLSHLMLTLTLIGIAFLVALAFVFLSSDIDWIFSIASTVQTSLLFCWNCFLKPHTGDKTRNQQDALESFYKAQASIYDSTRSRLLQGREDMLGIAAAHMKHRMENGAFPQKPVWVDIGGGTGYNVQAMGKYIDVAKFFSRVYVVDLSPSLCRVAEDRFYRLGWKNVKVVCQDARHFRLEDHEDDRTPTRDSASEEKHLSKRAHLITMSYSLSMIPEYYPVVDTLSALLAPDGIMGVVDFYVQSEVDYQSRNYTGGEINRHCMWISRTFYRTWFEADRVNLEAARRDYLEYRFGTVLSANQRCRLFGFRIPYYIWIGCSRDSAALQLKLAQLNAAATESPFISALDLQTNSIQDKQRQSRGGIRSKAYESAVVNLSASLPLPPSWYQTHHWRIYFDEHLEKHRQFKDDYIYAFTWEDARADLRLLKINEEDVIFAITSAGDNILAYAQERPKRIHAVDLNPSQNHLLELKVACFHALSYPDIWKLFGEGKHPDFRNLLLTKLAPHMSSLAFQYWLEKGPAAFSGQGFYSTGGSRHALSLARWLFNLVGLTKEVDHLCAAETLNEQREIWKRSIRRVLLSQLVAWTVVSNKKWLWRALGVPTAQREMIEQDYLKQVENPPLTYDSDSSSDDEKRSVSSQSSTAAYERVPRALTPTKTPGTGAAIWEYAVNTLDPVVHNTLVSADNPYYLVCLQGRYTPRCHPAYLTPRAHSALSRPAAFDGLRIHTDEIAEVVERMAPRTLTIAVLMDSMDWFDRFAPQAADSQIEKLNRALKMGGRVLLRSAGLEPWYVRRFAERGFVPKRVAKRVPGSCIDRVNMYASTWICTKVAEVDGGDEGMEGGNFEKSERGLAPLNLGGAALQE